MPRKITGIAIDNYRAWFGSYPKIELPNGENLLVYGENGSGKSSFFKGIQNFFRSAQNGNPPFELNRFAGLAGATRGEINIEFSDFSTTPPTVNSYVYALGIPNTNGQPFINDTRKLNSFLDYKHLLSVHFKDPEATGVPELFELLIQGLLGGLEIPATFTTVQSEIKTIENGLKRKIGSSPHSAAAAKISTIRGALALIINELISETNKLITTYFDNNLSVELADFQFVQNHKKIDKHLLIQVRYAGEVIPNYNYFLNEARLSAIAICFYLAAVLYHPPTATDYKILFLDDVFIGLDTSNRIPLLQILQTEFAGYQLFLTTYDRFWFEVAKDWFAKHMPAAWVFRDMYVHKGTHIAGRPVFDKTISVLSESHFARALIHLNNSAFPDYPAAANYLRKYAEEIFKKYLPEVELKQKNENIGEFPDFIMLNSLINTAKNFYGKIRQPPTSLTLLSSHSKRLLNPLSHYDPSTPIYKQELDELVALLPPLEQQLKNLKQSVYKESLTEHKKIRIRYDRAANDYVYFKCKLNDQLYKVQGSGGTEFSDCPVKSLSYLTDVGGVLSAETKRLNDYNTLEQCYNSLHAFIITMAGYNTVPVRTPWIDAFEYENPAVGALSAWLPMNALLVWP
jgi:energy-coupling factor transporter ATP-binding protein EcfA2